MIALGSLCMYVVQIQAAARSRVQDPHQCPLCIAVANLKTLHVSVPRVRSAGDYSTGSSSSNISDSAAPAGTIG